jgi:hypothetical protein
MYIKLNISVYVDMFKDIDIGLCGGGEGIGQLLPLVKRYRVK